MPNQDKGFCVTNSFSAPLYVSAVFDWPPPSVNLAAAEIAWGKFLAARHGYSGQGVNPAQQNPTYCSEGSRGDPVRMIAARVAGAKAAERKVVETGWRFGAAGPSGSGKPDDDPDPKPAPGPPPPPSPELREAATKDGAEALALCQNDRMQSGALDCYAVQRTVYNYRMAHGPGLPVAELLANDKLDCTTCFTPYNADEMGHQSSPIERVLTSQGRVCGTEVRGRTQGQTLLQPGQGVFEAAMKACPK